MNTPSIKTVVQDGYTVLVDVLITNAGDNEQLSNEGDTLEFTCGHHEIFEGIERAVLGLSVGDTAYIQLEPEEHVGDYDAELIVVKERDLFPDHLEEGMLLEGLPIGIEHALDTIETPVSPTQIYLVTDVTDEAVVLDGNHPLAGIALKFKLTVTRITKHESFE